MVYRRQKHEFSTRNSLGLSHSSELIFAVFLSRLLFWYNRSLTYQPVCLQPVKTELEL